MFLSISEGNWCNEGCRGKGRGKGRPEKGGRVMLYTDKSLLASHMITHMHTGRYMYKYVLCNSYNMATRALADLSPEGAKRPRAINQSSARGAML